MNRDRGWPFASELAPGQTAAVRCQFDYEMWVGQLAIEEPLVDRLEGVTKPLPTLPVVGFRDESGSFLDACELLFRHGVAKRRKRVADGENEPARTVTYYLMLQIADCCINATIRASLTGRRSEGLLFLSSA